jgi:hypothetical protein
MRFYKTMTENFEINDILNAVESISKIERSKGQKRDTKIDYTSNNGLLSTKNKAESNKSEILVLDQMIE